MSKKLRSDVSGEEIVKFLKSYGFVIEKKTRGSHLALSRKLSFGNQFLVVPRHKVVSRGTLRAIVRQSSKYIPEEDLIDKFYTK